MPKSPNKRAVKRLLSTGHPRMVGAADLGFIRGFAEKFSPDSLFLEMGPWLGYLSRELAQHGTLHVVDNFVWTNDHERRVPNLVTPGESFRPLFEAIMDHTKTSVTIHEGRFDTFSWTGPEISLLLIDSPKTATALRDCLDPVIESLKVGGVVLIKNGLNPKHHEMIAYVDRMISKGLFTHLHDIDSAGSNVLAVEVANTDNSARQILADLLDPHSVEVTEKTSAPGTSLGPYQIARIAQFVEAGKWSAAYSELAQIDPDPGNIELWERLEHSIKTDNIALNDLAAFSEILAQQNDPIAHLRPAVDITKGPMAAVRAFWSENVDKPWRTEAFKPSILRRACEFGYMAWPNQIREHLPGQDILEVGCGPGLHGLGYLCLGANSFLGVDPALRMDKDRAKNLTSKIRENFGWSPTEMSSLISPWQVQPIAFADLDLDRTFDLAIMFDSLAHVDNAEAALEGVAAKLRPGGKLIFRHKNFYCWNGHQQNPKSVDDIDLTDPEQRELVDWNHLSWDAPQDHYIVRSLNRVHLGTLLATTNRLFDIQTLEEIRSTERTGLGRLTPEIRKRFPDLDDRDFEVQSIFCVATLK